MTEPGRIENTPGCHLVLTALMVAGVCALFAPFRPATAEPEAAPISVIRTEPGDSHERRLDAAYRAYRAGNCAAARPGYEQVLQAYPDNRDAMLGLAACAVMEGEVKPAADMYRRILRAFPRDVLSRAALVSLQQERQGEAVIKELLARQPDEPYLHVALGQLQSAQARWPEAHQAFSAACQIDPANPVYALNLAVSLDRMGRSQEALEHYRTTLKLVRQSASSLDIRPVLRRVLALKGQ